MTTSNTPASFIHPSNALTYGSLLLGVAAMGVSTAGSGPAAGALIAGAVLCDTFDGRFARRFSRTPALEAMGVQLDSLVDGVTFGIVPPIIASLLLGPTGHLPLMWWGSAFVYAGCALTRLGFYNVCQGERSGFIGLPVPVAALLWSTLLLAGPNTAAATALALVAAAAMISPLRIPRPSGARLALFVVWPLTLIVAHAIRLG